MSFLSSILSSIRPTEEPLTIAVSSATRLARNDGSPAHEHTHPTVQSRKRSSYPDVASPSKRARLGDHDEESDFADYDLLFPVQNDDRTQAREEAEDGTQDETLHHQADFDVQSEFLAEKHFSSTTEQTPRATDDYEFEDYDLLFPEGASVSASDHTTYPNDELATTHSIDVQSEGAAEKHFAGTTEETAQAAEGDDFEDFHILFSDSNSGQTLNNTLDVNEFDNTQLLHSDQPRTREESTFPARLRPQSHKANGESAGFDIPSEEELHGMSLPPKDTHTECFSKDYDLLSSDDSVLVDVRETRDDSGRNIDDGCGDDRSDNG